MIISFNIRENLNKIIKKSKNKSEVINTALELFLKDYSECTLCNEYFHNKVINDNKCANCLIMQGEDNNIIKLNNINNSYTTNKDSTKVPKTKAEIMRERMQKVSPSKFEYYVKLMNEYKANKTMSDPSVKEWFKSNIPISYSQFMRRLKSSGLG